MTSDISSQAVTAVPREPTEPLILSWTAGTVPLLAKWLLPGDDSSGIILTIILGILRALVGGVTRPRRLFS